MSTHALIKSLSESMGIAPPETLCGCDCRLISEMSLKHISFLAYVASHHESSTLSDKYFVNVVNQWENESGFSFNSRELPYKLKNFYFSVVLGNKRPRELAGFRCAGIGGERQNQVLQTPTTA